MYCINSIVNYDKHPINDINYIQECNLLIKKNSLLVLEKFLLDKSLKYIFYILVNYLLSYNNLSYYVCIYEKMFLILSDF